MTYWRYPNGRSWSISTTSPTWAPPSTEPCVTGPDRAPSSVLHLVALLHPTPAVGGVPRAPALALIARLEGEPRGPYAGPVGYVDDAGDGRLDVGIRAMTVAGDTVTLTAGVGVVEGSRPETEREEATLKFAAVFDALAPGVAFGTSGRTSATRWTGRPDAGH